MFNSWRRKQKNNRWMEPITTLETFSVVKCQWRSFLPFICPKADHTVWWFMMTLDSESTDSSSLCRSWIAWCFMGTQDTAHSAVNLKSSIWVYTLPFAGGSLGTVWLWHLSRNASFFYSIQPSQDQVISIFPSYMGYAPLASSMKTHTSITFNLPPDLAQRPSQMF